MCHFSGGGLSPGPRAARNSVLVIIHSYPLGSTPLSRDLMRANISSCLQGHTERHWRLLLDDLKLLSEKERELARAVSDPEGHPLTWGRVLTAHRWLVRHASCGANGYDSDEDAAGCPCLWHQEVIEERSSHELVCRAWPGPVCGSCWAASCQCGYVFDDAQHASGRWHDGRLRCHACDDTD